MSEKTTNKDKLFENQPTPEVDERAERYTQLNELRQACEDDGRAVVNSLTTLQRTDNPDQAKLAKLKAYFELDEVTVADVEKSMSSLESQLGYGPNRSTRFHENSNDILVNSAIFYHDRIVELRSATGQADIDEAFVDAIIRYASAVEHDGNSFVVSRYDDLSRKQEYIQNCQKRRSSCHNDMIQEINRLNDKANKAGVKPPIYRNLAMNSVANGYRNDSQMYHDRVTLAHYVSILIENDHDNPKLPDAKYIKET